MEISILKTPTMTFIIGNFNLFDKQVAFLSIVSEMPKIYTLKRYNILMQLLKFVQNRESATQVAPCFSGPCHNLG